ncbi:MAG: hypothetical protein KDJ50_06235 [Alphaproteobacteria bacterium]|nr:hypothetical protein [Alphaproteobacteria bacterium]
MTQLVFDPKNIRVNHLIGQWTVIAQGYSYFPLKTTGREVNAVARNRFEAICGAAVTAFHEVREGNNPICLVNFSNGQTIGFREKPQDVISFFEKMNALRAECK